MRTGGLLILALVALALWWTPTVASSQNPGVYIEVTLPDGYTRRFGPVIIGPGDRLAFGFYKLVLNGSGYVEFDNIVPTAGTIAALVMPYDSPDWNAIASNDEARSWRLYISQVSNNYEFMRRDNNSNAYVVSDGLAENYTLVWVEAYTYGDRLEIKATSTGTASWPGSPAQPAEGLLVGSNMYNGVEQQAQRWIGEIHTLVILGTPGVDPSNYIIPGSSLELLFDPSWYNPDTNSFLALTSTGYIEGKLMGTAELSSDTPRMWVLQDSYSDPYLHVSMLPYGSILRIIDSRGNVLGEYSVIGDNWGVYVKDYPIPWPLANQGGSRQGVLDYLALAMVPAALLAPLVAWYTEIVAGLTMALLAGISVLLDVREYAGASGWDRSIWLGLGLLSTVMLILAISISIMRMLDRYTRRLRVPRVNV